MVGPSSGAYASGGQSTANVGWIYPLIKYHQSVLASASQGKYIHTDFAFYALRAAKKDDGIAVRPHQALSVFWCITFLPLSIKHNRHISLSTPHSVEWTKGS